MDHPLFPAMGCVPVFSFSALGLSGYAGQATLSSPGDVRSLKDFCFFLILNHLGPFILIKYVLLSLGIYSFSLFSKGTLNCFSGAQFSIPSAFSLHVHYCHWGYGAWEKNSRIEVEVVLWIKFMWWVFMPTENSSPDASCIWDRVPEHSHMCLLRSGHLSGHTFISVLASRLPTRHTAPLGQGLCHSSLRLHCRGSAQ